MNHDDKIPLARKLHLAKLAARVSLGLVWLYEGLVPKLLYLGAHPAQIELVKRSRLFWPTPELTLVALGFAQALAGVVLIAGWAERRVVTVATAAMFVLIVLVATGEPALLTDPFGALAKDLCLVACAFVVWLLAPTKRRVQVATSARCALLML